MYVVRRVPLPFRWLHCAKTYATKHPRSSKPSAHDNTRGSPFLKGKLETRPKPDRPPRVFPKKKTQYSARKETKRPEGKNPFLKANLARPRKPSARPTYRIGRSDQVDVRILPSEPNFERVTTDWGEDKLRPPTSLGEEETLPTQRHSPTHVDNAFTYSRRLEGLLKPPEGSVLEDVAPTSKHRPIARLAHGLDRVLYNPGVHWLQDPRSRVYNFSPYLENIPKVTEFAFERLVGFVKSSRDEDLWDLAKHENRKYAGSTSSLSGMLSHIYFLISEDKPVNTSRLSAIFQGEPRTFTPGQRMPASVNMVYNDGVYAIDSTGKDDTEKNILTWLGTLLEKFLTMTPTEFSSYMRSKPPPLGEEEPMREAYRYAKTEHFVMRSQLDCQDLRLPGTGVFDLKTRACLPIRMDILNFEENSGYLIKSQTGLMGSFEREYYDLIRSAFLKYSFQVRIGNMDGVLVAYHNTARMFGFQYVPLEEMDEALYGNHPGAGDRVFNMCVKLLEVITNEITGCFPEQSVQCMFEKEETKNVLNIWIEPVQGDAKEEDRPIQQLEVKIENFLNHGHVRGSQAVSEVELPWLLRYSISKLSGLDTDIRSSLRNAKARQFREYVIPSGVENMEEWWKQLNFSGNPRPEVSLPYDSKNFRQPDSRIQKLRSVSRSGREESERLAGEQLGMPKYILGVPDPIPAEILQALKENGGLSMATYTEVVDSFDTHLASSELPSPQLEDVDPELLSVVATGDDQNPNIESLLVEPSEPSHLGSDNNLGNSSLSTQFSSKGVKRTSPSTPARYRLGPHYHHREGNKATE